MLFRSTNSTQLPPYARDSIVDRRRDDGDGVPPAPVLAGKAVGEGGGEGTRRPGKTVVAIEDCLHRALDRVVERGWFAG